MNKNKRNKIICGVTLFVLALIFGVIIYSIFDAIHSLDKEVIAKVNETDYSASEFAHEFHVDVKEEEKFVIVSNGESDYYCKFDVKCEVWPNSHGGTVLWEAPMFSVTFRRE